MTFSEIDQILLIAFCVRNLHSIKAEKFQPGISTGAFPDIVDHTFETEVRIEPEPALFSNY
jgi:hypothetical protein